MNSPAKAPPWGARVLVIDDEPHLVLTSVACTNPYQDFTYEDFTVFGAHSREEALEAVRQKLADVVILDVTKPGLDGLGTLEELRQFSEIPVLILTDLGDEDQAVRGLLLGADDYLTKPLNLRDLWRRIMPGHHALRLAAGQWTSVPVVVKTRARSHLARLCAWLETAELPPPPLNALPDVQAFDVELLRRQVLHSVRVGDGDYPSAVARLQYLAARYGPPEFAALISPGLA